MNTHDYLILSAAVTRYAELLTIAEHVRLLRKVEHSTPSSVAVWQWFRQRFRQYSMGSLYAWGRGASGLYNHAERGYK